MLLSPFVWYWSGLCECVSLEALVKTTHHCLSLAFCPAAKLSVAGSNPEGDFAWSWDSHGQIVAVFAILGPASRAARRDSWAICQWLQALPTWSKLIKPLSFGSGSNFDSCPHCSSPNFLSEAEATAASYITASLRTIMDLGRNENKQKLVCSKKSA